MKNPWSILKSKKIYANPWISLTEHQVLTPTKTQGIYGVIHFKNVAVGVIAIDDLDRVLLVGQYRFPLKRYTWEIPEGGCPKGETALRAAKRELLEETGYQAKRFKKILDLDLSNSVTDERAEVFLASGLVAGLSAPDETEDLKTKWLPLKKALKLIDTGEITDAITVAALLKVASLKVASSKVASANAK